MAAYRLSIKRSAERELKRIPKAVLPRIVRRIKRLASNPRPRDSVKLSRRELYRVRQGDYRVVYSIDDRDRTVVVVKIGHRREVYR